MAVFFVMDGHKDLEPHRLITAQLHFYLFWMATKALSHKG